MKITQVRWVVVNHPLREERVVVSHAGRHDSSKFLIVAVQDADGRVGYGEAATTSLWSGETAETAAAIIGGLFEPRLKGMTIDHPREALAEMDRLAWSNPFTKSAIDTALWDLWAKQWNAPAAALFGDRPAVKCVASRASIGAYDVAKTVELAKGFVDAGVKTLKFKVGVPPFDDAARLRAVRDALGKDLVFTVDYNGSFRDAGAAAAHIESLLPYDVTIVEQPTHRDRIALMAEVRKRVKVSILADEAIFTPDHLTEALEAQAMDAVSIYPGKNGGFTHSLTMAGMCRRAGVACAIGSNLETDLGQAAMVSLAASCSAFPVDRLACDLASSLFYAKSSVTEPLVFADGSLQAPQGVGFGVTPVEKI